MKKLGISWVTFAGKRIEYRPETPGEHYRLIVAATRAKVRQNPEVRKVLLATGDLILKPDHHQGPNPPAAWRYYEILTLIRSELQKTGSAVIRVDEKTLILPVSERQNARTFETTRSSFVCCDKRVR
jgi:hypothetical protein